MPTTVGCSHDLEANISKDHGELSALQNEARVILAWAGRLKLPKSRLEMLIVISIVVLSCSK